MNWVRVQIRTKLLTSFALRRKKGGLKKGSEQCENQGNQISQSSTLVDRHAYDSCFAIPLFCGPL